MNDDSFFYNGSGSNNLLESFDSKSFLGEKYNNFGFQDNLGCQEIPNNFDNIMVKKNDNFFNNDEISNENSFIGKKRNDSKVSNNELRPKFSKETQENTPPEENILIGMINKNEDKIHNDNGFKTKNDKKMIFKVNRDLTIEEILRKYNVPNAHITDYFFKHFKTKFVNYYTDGINNLIKRCNFENKISDLIIPNHESFQGHSNYSDNKKFLKYKMEDIYTNIDFIKKYKGGNQLQNKNIIYKIKNTECENKNAYEKLIYLLNLELEEAYKLFYDDSIAFFGFAKDEKTRYYDYYFPKNYRYSLLQKYRIIDFINNKKINK